MALPWPHGSTQTLPNLSPVVRTPARDSAHESAHDSAAEGLARARAVAAAPTTALVVMLLGLALLFALPMVGLPFVALVVLPTVLYHLRVEHRSRLRARRRGTARR